MSNLPSLNECAGNTASGEAWFDIWKDEACYNALYDTMFSSNGSIKFDPDGYRITQNTMGSVFDNYLKTNKITVPGADGYNVFQETIRSTCIRLPGSCDPVLKNYCHSCPDCGSREDISDSPATLAFCGCYAPAPATSNNLTPQCDPLCTRIETIPLPDNKGNSLRCNDNVCVINDITIQAAKSSIGTGTIDFRQVCNVCGSGACKCIISGIDISETLKSIGVTEDFEQLCGPDSTCLETQPDGVDKVVDCKSNGPTASSSTNITLWIIIAGIAFIAILGAIIFILKRK